MRERLDALHERFSGFSHRLEPLGRHTTLRVGGEAQLFLVPRTAQEVTESVAALAEAGVPLFLLGGGSNLLIRDAGYDGAVMNLAPLRWVDRKGLRMRVGAGTPLALVIRRAMEAGLRGMEGLVGIPGTVGGAVFMNAGGRHAEMRDVVESVRVVDRRGHESVLRREEIGFRYRGTALGDLVVTEAHLRLERGDKMQICQRMAEVLKHKRDTQPLGTRSAGCVFKNPGSERAAAWLIDQSGLKGLRVGGAQVSPRHANLIVNHQKATARDVLGLIQEVRREVLLRWGTPLQLEVRVLGARGLEAA
jgi:UDP-N-acetylmuramate dehydrogenase